MRYVVTQAFNTPLRRLPVGALIEGDEMDGPLTALDWFDRGFLRHIAAAEEDVSVLQDEAAALGIEIDRRWGAKRLRDEIEAKNAANREAAVLALAADADLPEDALSTDDRS